MRKERIDVRIEPDLLEELDAIAQRSGQSRSAIIRDAVENLVLENKDEWNSVGLHVNLTYEGVEVIQNAIMNSDAHTPDQAIDKALEFWGRDREDHHINRKPRMREIAEENMRKRQSLGEMQNSAKQLARK